MKPDGGGAGSSSSVKRSRYVWLGSMNSSAGRLGDQNVGLAGVDADVAAPVGLSAQHLGELVGVGERLTENQSAPTEFEHDVIRHRVDQVRR